LVIPAFVTGSIALIAFSVINAVVAPTFIGRSLALNSNIVAEGFAMVKNIEKELARRNIRFNQAIVTIVRNYSLDISLIIFEVLELGLHELVLQFLVLLLFSCRRSSCFSCFY